MTFLLILIILFYIVFGIVDVRFGFLCKKEQRKNKTIAQIYVGTKKIVWILGTIFFLIGILEVLLLLFSFNIVPLYVFLVMCIAVQWGFATFLWNYFCYSAVFMNEEKIYFYHKRKKQEISLENIKEIREKVPDIELEVFVHGAMCMAISGRCLLSNYMTGRDANRGDCAQACRWKYSLVEETRPGETMPVYEDEHGTYIFNSKDLCTIEMIDKILDAGVDSLKIEGRMKGIYYVSNCVKVYKDALNSYYSGNFEYNPEWRNELESISNRSYTEGFYHGKAGVESQNYNNRNSYSQTHKLVAKIEKKLSDNEYLVAIRNKLFVGQAVQIVSPEIKVRDFIMPEMILLDKMGRETESVESANPNSFVKIKTDTPMNELDMLRIVL